MLSGRLSLGRSELLSLKSTLERLPGLIPEGLRGGILYHDGQFDDARYAIALLRTFQDLGGTAINYVEAVGLLRHGGKVIGIQARDREDGVNFDVQAKVVINACGVETEDILAMDGAARGSLLALSQGTHFVLSRSFLPGNTALMIPKTADGRVLFAIPWHGATIVGTTDEPVDRALAEPRALFIEKKFLLDHITRYFGRTPAASEILSVWSGLRPLGAQRRRQNLAVIQRPHHSGFTIRPGYRYRREVDHLPAHGTRCHRSCLRGCVPPKRPSRTLELKLHGWVANSDAMPAWERVYGSDLPLLQALSNEDATLDALTPPATSFSAARSCLVGAL